MDSLAFPLSLMLDAPLIFVGVVLCIIGKAAYSAFHIKNRDGCKSATALPQKDWELVPPFEVEEVDTSHAEPGAEPDAEPSVVGEGLQKSTVRSCWWKSAVVIAILALTCPAMYQLLSEIDVIDTPSTNSSPLPEQTSQHSATDETPVHVSAQPDPTTSRSAETQIGTGPASEQTKESLPSMNMNKAGIGEQHIGEQHPLALGALDGIADEAEISSAIAELDQPGDVDEDAWGEDDNDCFGGEPALIVKLARTIVEINHKTNYVKSDYHGTILVGTPGLPMSVVFDTGSGHLLLPSMYCKTEACKVHTRYRRSGSSTGRDINFNGSAVVRGLPRDSITVEFGTGEATGVVVEDIVCMGQATNATVDGSLWNGKDGLEPGCMRMHFLAATDLSEDPFINFGFDGVLGLSLLGLSQTPHHNFLTVLSQLIEDRHVCASQSFGVFLANNEQEDSDIAFGGWNEGHLLEELSWAPVHDPSLGHWIIPIKSIRVDDERMDFCDDGRCKAAVDTGTALLSVPPKIFREMFELLRHEADLAGHCKGHGPLLHFEFEDFSVSLSPKEYSASRKTKKNLMRGPEFEEDPPSNDTDIPRRRDFRCFPLLMTLELEEPLGPKLFILGEPVLRKYYTVYDARLKRVGFGRAVHVAAPTREELFAQAPELDGIGLNEKGINKKRRRIHPTMFDVFRWRQALKVLPGLRKSP